MTPFLSPLSAKEVMTPTRRGPPSGFRPIIGDLSSVAFSSWKQPKSKGSTAAQKLGLRYERKVTAGLMERFGPEAFCPQPSISFADSSGHRLAIPDGLLRLNNCVAIVEIKYTHCELAWWQLRRLYEPLLQRLTTAPIILIEVCHSYDPSVILPEPHSVLLDIVSQRTNAPIQVVPWKI